MTLVQTINIRVHLPIAKRRFLSRFGTFFCELCRDAERYASAVHQVYVSPFEPNRLLRDCGQSRDVQRDHRKASWEGPF